MSLAKKNQHKKDKHISFKEEGHQYIVDGDKTFTSTTTWLHQHFKPFDSGAIIKNMMASKNWPNSKYYGMKVNEIKQGWDTNGKLASEAGTKMHSDIEDYYNDIPVVNESIEYSYFKKFIEDHTHLTPYRSEWCVWDKDLKLCGSIDMVYKNPDGTLRIYDWKRSKEIKKSNNWGNRGLVDCIQHIHDSNYWHYALQLNVYKALLERTYGFCITELAIVVMHPDNETSSYEKYIIPDLQKEVSDLFELRSEEVNSIEVEEKYLKGIMYLVGDDGKIYKEDGHLTGENWSDIIRRD